MWFGFVGLFFLVAAEHFPAAREELKTNSHFCVAGDREIVWGRQQMRANLCFSR